MDKMMQDAILRCLIDLKTEIASIKTDVNTINKNIVEIKQEHELYRSAFPNGIEDHREFHKKRKKKFFFF